jgi:glutamate synthase (NADPH/NADH) small chain
MSDTTSTSPAAPGKFAWFEVAGAGQPKRFARDRVADFLEIYGPYDEQTAREQASRCLQCPAAPCRSGCPLGNRIPEWMLLTAEGHFLEAAALTRTTSNIPEICSRVCPQENLCEGACVLNGKAEPVSIGAIERFLNEYAFAHGAGELVPAAPNGLRVAVLGAGPGGLACADELAKLGYAVTVYDAGGVPGGLLVNGIPAFKLEKSAVQRRTEMLRRRGVKFELGVRVGRDVSLRDLHRRYDALFLGFGAQHARELDVPGAQLKGVSQALSFIVEKNTDVPLDIPPIEVQGRRVLVLGGGDTAMDCLRTALRCGATQALCVYRRDRENMPGNRKEYDNSLEEGAQFMFLTSPVEIKGNAAGEVEAVRCVRMELGPADASGRRSPRKVAGSEFEIPAGVVLVAYGFDPVPHPLWSDIAELAKTEWSTVKVDADQRTSVPGIFAGGDLVRGPSLVVHAVRDGRRAARSIHRYLFNRRVNELAASETDHVSP